MFHNTLKNKDINGTSNFNRKNNGFTIYTKGSQGYSTSPFTKEVRIQKKSSRYNLLVTDVPKFSNKWSYPSDQH